MEIFEPIHSRWKITYCKSVFSILFGILWKHAKRFCKIAKKSLKREKKWQVLKGPLFYGTRINVLLSYSVVVFLFLAVLCIPTGSRLIYFILRWYLIVMAWHPLYKFKGLISVALQGLLSSIGSHTFFLKEERTIWWFCLYPKSDRTR